MNWLLLLLVLIWNVIQVVGSFPVDFLENYEYEARKLLHEIPSPSPSPPEGCTQNYARLLATIIPIAISGIFICICIISCARCRQSNRLINSSQLATVVRNRQNETQNIDSANVKAILTSLPSREFKGGDKEGEGDNDKMTCAICLEEMEQGQRGTLLPCAHWFHTECIEGWVKRMGEKSDCPLCKSELTKTITSEATDDTV